VTTDAPDDPDDREPYPTVAGPGETRFEVRGSEFYGFVDTARSQQAAETFVDAVREEYPDATHVVPAYRVRGTVLRAYADDDGEPSGSAGDPALNVLEQRELENVVAAVVRYYGGTNLGVGGLARSYARAVADAVDDAGVVTERPHDSVRVEVGYDDSGTVRSALESADVDFEADYAERVTFVVRVPVVERESLLETVRSATSGRAAIDADDPDAADPD
jgi:Uncharacterized conserved protein